MSERAPLDFPSYAEWLPGWIVRQKARRKRLKLMIAEVRMRHLGTLR